ncbi:protein peste-like [Zophobas morio]|uniref:protein peste-like n=1 Tax=Zophobas morio TaxID=2755281 RepID=UPI0030835B3C
MWKKPWPIIVSSILCFAGLVIVFVTPIVLKSLVFYNSILRPESRVYNLWKHFPVRVSVDFYFFNWTNPEDIYSKGVKPRFAEVGPYTYMVDLGKTDIVWNDNNTVTFRPIKYYYYSEDKSNGDLQDRITCPNPVSIAAAHVSRNWNYVVRRGLSLTLSGIAPTVNISRTIDELLFTGYPDTLTKMAKTFPFFAGTEIPPWERFGWFYKRNGTSDLEGIYNTGTGINSIFAKIYKWNYWSKSPYYEGTCADIDGSTGEKFDQDSLGDRIKIFSMELCRAVVLQYVGDVDVDGISGRKYQLDDYMLDNGTKYPETKCSCSGDCLPYGVFNISRCRYGSPAFGSLPHFHKAEPYFNSLVEGLHPEKEKHDFYIVVEPYTGFTLQARARLQINLLLHSIPGVTIYENVPTAFLPIMWFDHRIDVPDSELFMLKQILNVRWISTTIGVVMMVAGLLLVLYFIMKQRRRNVRMKETLQNKVVLKRPEEKKLLSEK